MKAQTQTGVKAKDSATHVETATRSLLRRFVYVQVRWVDIEDSAVPEGVQNVLSFDHRFIVAIDAEAAYIIGFEHMQGDGLLNDYVIDITEDK